MRVIVFLDSEAKRDEFEEALERVKSIYRTQVGVEMEVVIETRYFPRPAPEYETSLYEIYYGSYWGMRRNLLRAFADEMTQRHGKRYDHVVVAVDHKNWVPVHKTSPVWGWSISAGINGYEVQQIRVDSASTNRESRVINTMGALYHELMHSHDGFIYRMTGVRIEPLISVSDWDEDVVHGRGEDWNYIGRTTGRENLEALASLKNVLPIAYARRAHQFNNGTPFIEKVQEAYRASMIAATEPFAKPCIHRSLYSPTNAYDNKE